ncbi:MAG TPA: hypothetical protein VE961_03970 [Pyrinomonadaceae bacterium]|nr:hypothetical protein [Pyrinomonadaceae bacterium]
MAVLEEMVDQEGTVAMEEMAVKAATLPETVTAQTESETAAMQVTEVTPAREATVAEEAMVDPVDRVEQLL